MLNPQDRWDIADVLSRYCFAADFRDMDLLDEVFTEDAECIFQTGTCASRDELKVFMSSVLVKLSATQHNVTSSIVTASAGGAEGRTYLIVQHVRSGAEGGETFALGGTYLDRFCRTEAGWRIYRRELTGTWRAGNPTVMDRPPA